MNWSSFIRDYLTFTRKERIGVLIIAALILVIYLLPSTVSSITRPRILPVDTAWMAALEKLEFSDSGFSNEGPQNTDENNLTNPYERTKSTYRDADLQKAELFFFDPNTISPTEWKRLGLRDRTIHTIQNYLSKGGRFHQPEDLLKVYGLHKDEYSRLLPYIKIEPRATFSRDTFAGPKQRDETQKARPPAATFVAVDINTADTSAFISLPGIGTKLASRIVSFREKLGGFYSINQIAETYGLADSTFQKLKQYLRLDDPSVKKMNINTATIDELKRHPYIKFSLANLIVAYRNEHGTFAKIEDIKKVIAVTDEIYRKIVPYLIVQ